MREVRLSIPIIGGITVIYTQEEITAKKEAVKASVIRHMTNFRSSLTHVEFLCKAYLSERRPAKELL